MTLESVDFQALTHQQITRLMEIWRRAGLSEEDIQEAANQFFQFGMIAAQQMQQEGGVQAEGSQQTMAYTPAMAENVVQFFLEGMTHALLKAQEHNIPSQEKWYLMQNVAMHVFDNSKQVAIITMDAGGGDASNIAIPPEQIQSWLSQTAIEALLYYIMEYEKQNGPLIRTDVPGVPNLLGESEEPQIQPQMDNVVDTAFNASEAEQQQTIQNVTPAVPQVQPQQQQPQQQPAHQPSETDHKYAALGLLLSGMSAKKQEKILATLSPEQQQTIATYRDPERIAREMDLNRVVKYLKHFKEKLGGNDAIPKSEFVTPLAHKIAAIPPHRLERLFQDERPLIRVFVQQFIASQEESATRYSLPPGVEESLLHYLNRNFPEEALMALDGGRR